MEPQFVNPATLQFSGVVESDWICEKGVRIGIMESNFSYTNGVQIEASDDTVCFRHSGAELADGGALSAELAKRYAAGFDYDNWFAISLEFAGVIELTAYPVSAGESPWPSFADHLIHDGVLPDYRTNAFYDCPDRRLMVELFQSSRSNHTQLNCLARVHRYLDHNQDGQSEHQLESVLTGWKTDWEDAVAAVTRLAEATLGSGDF